MKKKFQTKNVPDKNGRITSNIYNYRRVGAVVWKLKK